MININLTRKKKMTTYTEITRYAMRLDKAAADVLRLLPSSQDFYEDEGVAMVEIIKDVALQYNVEVADLNALLKSQDGK